MKPFSWTWVLILLTGAAFVPDQVASFATVKTRKGSSSTISTVTATTLYQASHPQRHSANDEQGGDNDDSEEHASPLHLSALDCQRLTRLQECRTEIPILIVGQALLPQQKLTFESSDPRFHRLYEYCLQTGSKLGILGLHPTTGRPLNQGVTVDLTSSPAIVVNCYHHHSHHHSLVNRVIRRLCVTGQERFTVQEQPWLDAESESFFVAHVEMVHDDRYKEPLTARQQAHAQTLADETLPALLQEWSQLMSRTVFHENKNNNSNKTDKKKAGSGQQQRRLIEAMPQDLTQRALWVAAMLNPSDQQQQQHDDNDDNNNVGLVDIRPAMLAASNDYDRTVLAVQAVQSSIDHLSGKRRL